MKIMVIAPHPDDEVLGVGGIIARATASKHEVVVAIITKGTEDIFPTTLIEQCREESASAHNILGVKKTIYLDFPAAKLDTIPHHIINETISNVIRSENPNILLLPFPGDLHKDHQIVFESALVGARPAYPNYPKNIYTYETLSETNWNDITTKPRFSPTLFVDISEYLNIKLNALKCYSSQLKPFPNERSLEAVESLARFRGATVTVKAAEALSAVRVVL